MFPHFTIKLQSGSKQGQFPQLCPELKNEMKQLSGNNVMAGLQALGVTLPSSAAPNTNKFFAPSYTYNAADNVFDPSYKSS